MSDVNLFIADPNNYKKITCTNHVKLWSLPLLFSLLYFQCRILSIVFKVYLNEFSRIYCRCERQGQAPLRKIGTILTAYVSVVHLPFYWHLIEKTQFEEINNRREKKRICDQYSCKYLNVCTEKYLRMTEEEIEKGEEYSENIPNSRKGNTQKKGKQISMIANNQYGQNWGEYW